jgi:hypothetical protein
MPVAPATFIFSVKCFAIHPPTQLGFYSVKTISWERSMRALASHRGGKTPEPFALPASSLGLTGDPPANQNNPLWQLMRAGG